MLLLLQLYLLNLTIFARIHHMNKVIISFATLAQIILVGLSVSGQVNFQQRSTDVGRIKMTFSNAGTIGRPQVRSNVQGAPSMAFPVKGKEHLFESGIWIGALVDGQTQVSTSAVDASNGYSTGGNGFEFTPLGAPTERSKLTSSPNYSANAVSHQDFVLRFSDEFVVVPGTSIPIAGHLNPLKASVKLETYAWNFSFADFFVICNYEITNNSDKTWDSIWVGQWADLVVRDVTVTRDAGTAFFNKGRNSVDQNYQAVYAWLGSNTADDADYIQSYGAMQFLGMDWRGMFFNPNKPDTFVSRGFAKPQVTFNFWNFNSVNPPFTTPQNDQERYLKMKTAIDSVLLQGPTGPANGQPNNWIQLISAGPLPSVAPGEKFNYVIAYVCARKLTRPVSGTGITTTPESRAELTEHFKRTKSTFLGEDVNEEGKYNAALDLNGNGILDRYILPEPPSTPKTRIVARNNGVDIYWDASSIESVDPITRKKDFEGFKLYRSNAGDDLDRNLADDNNLVAQWDSAGNDIGYNNGFTAIQLNEPVRFDDDTTSYRFKYSMNNLLNGWQYKFLLTAFDKGDKVLGVPSLESSFTENEFSVFAGSTPSAIKENTTDKVGVYPNPYRTNAAWDGATSRTRKLYFYNLPARCEINIFPSSGELIASLDHNSESYNGKGAQWFDNFTDASRVVMSGGEHAWDLLTTTKNNISSGVYIFTVKDIETGFTDTGKFTIIK
jgi:hypothetical protein